MCGLGMTKGCCGVKKVLCVTMAMERNGPGDILMNRGRTCRRWSQYRSFQ